MIASESEAPSKAAPRGALLIVFLVVFIDLLGFGIVIPILPRIAKHYVENQFDPAVTGVMIGLMMASFSLMQFIVAPIWGRLSDRIGRRPILLLGLAGSVFFYAIFGFACTLPPEQYATLALVILFATRIGQGIAGATIGTAQAVIADCTPPEKRKHGMALIGAAFGIGFTFGPLLGFAVLASDSETERFEYIGYSAAILSGIAFILGVWLLPETRQFGKEPPIQRKWLDGAALSFVFGNRSIAPVVLTFFLSTLGFSGFETTFAWLLKDSFNLKIQHSFLFFAYVGFVLAIVQGFYRPLANKLSEVTFMAIGILGMAIGVGVLGYVTYLATHAPKEETLISIWFFKNPIPIHNEPLLPYLMLGITAAVFGFAFLTPSAQALVSRRTPADRQGEILGLNQSASSMARILGPVFGMSLYQLESSHMLPYVFGAGILLLMLPMLPMIKRG